MLTMKYTHTASKYKQQLIGLWWETDKSITIVGDFDRNPKVTHSLSRQKESKL